MVAELVLVFILGFSLSGILMNYLFPPGQWFKGYAVGFLEASKMLDKLRPKESLTFQHAQDLEARLQNLIEKQEKESSELQKSFQEKCTELDNLKSYHETLKDTCNRALDKLKLLKAGIDEVIS